MKISIVTVSYNSAATIRDTFNSVLAQTYRDIEYIVVDGASKDGTVDIIKEYEPRFEGRMHWVSEPDEGLYDAMNKGIRMATGDVVGIINSDDFFTDDTIVEEIAGGFSDEVDAVYGDVHFVNPKNLKKTVRYYSSAFFSRRLMRFGLIPAHPTFYCRKKLFEEHGYYRTDFRIAADFDLLLRFIFIHRIRTRYIRLDMVAMRTGGASTENMASRIKILNEQVKSMKEHGVLSNRVFLCLRYLYKLTEFK